ncbi:metallophosphoesterase [Paenibacillus sp. NPDC058177]|uniref:metallophosphoesterase n=1 Tax=Paenibacillus sp. NPDC058177 TaxID=3346369 RepID=UPI0036DF19D0
MADLIFPNNNVPIEPTENPIVFISDLHFDYTKRKFKAKAASQMKSDFITFIKERYADSIICLAGDFFDSYKKTLSFVKELEENQILGFFVLGNHDYWNNGTKSHQNIINLFSDETQDNQYFKFLVTGRKYYYKDICVIGDTGWTSFRRGKRQVTLKQFMGLPDAQKVKDFSPKKIMSLHDEWVSFANGVLNEEEKVLIVTHFPMIDFTNKDKDCWWSSTTALKGANSWRIFGHTHRTEQQYNNVSSQRGYNNSDAEDLERRGFKQYYVYAFGKLEKSADQYSLIASSNFESISKFHSPIVVSNVKNELALIATIKQRGYKRCASNKHNFAVLANSPEAYLEVVKEITDGYLRDTYIGYSISGRISRQVVKAIYHSIAIIESGDFSDIRAFMTAAVITGYVFNRMPLSIEGMRPLDDYDVVRFWLMLLTMKQYGIDMGVIDTVRSDKKKHITFCNVDVYLPAVNNLSLNEDEVKMLMDKTPLLPRSIVLLENQSS